MVPLKPPKPDDPPGQDQVTTGRPHLEPPSGIPGPETREASTPSPLQVSLKMALDKVNTMELYDSPVTFEMIMRMPKPQRALSRRMDEINARYFAAEADSTKTPDDPHAPARERLRAGCGGGTMGVTNYVMPPHSP